ncbi:MAG: metal-sensitive transcriptional regulator [Candidatus Lokiarchaeota archaeon]|nr:metal-sensitive transcriptional regulator [Candidatus Lokiarchaeota archaeon]
MKIKIKMKQSKKQILNRMNYLIGHLEGVKKMISEEKYCIDIIQQNEAVIAALKKVNQIILKNHLNTCVTEAIRGKNEKERKKKIRELLEIFKKSDK